MFDPESCLGIGQSSTVGDKFTVVYDPCASLRRRFFKVFLDAGAEKVEVLRKDVGLEKVQTT